jgi:hypothetical protein
MDLSIDRGVTHVIMTDGAERVVRADCKLSRVSEFFLACEKYFDANVVRYRDVLPYSFYDWKVFCNDLVQHKSNSIFLMPIDAEQVWISAVRHDGNLHSLE